MARTAHTCQAAHGGDTLAVVGHRQQSFPGVLGKSWKHFCLENVGAKMLHNTTQGKEWIYMIASQEKKIEEKEGMHRCAQNLYRLALACEKKVKM